MKTNIVVLITILALGAGFAGGYFLRNFQTARNRGSFANGQFQRFNGAGNGQNGVGMMGRGGVVGSILSIDDKGITVKLADGSSKIVLFSDATTYSNTVSASKSDLKAGENVAVFGAANSDGSVTATSVQLNPEFGRPQASPTPTSK